MSDRIVQLCNEIEKHSAKESWKTVAQLLDELKQIPMTSKVLKDTDVGLKINTLRKETTEKAPNISAAAKALVIQWRKTIDTPPSIETGERIVKRVKVENGSGPSTPVESLNTPSEPMYRSSPVTACKRPVETLRDKCVNMFITALSQDGDDQLGNVTAKEIEYLACHIEAAVQSVHPYTKPEYKDLFRSRYLNLHRADNGALRRAVIEGRLTPQRLAQMTTTELAPEEMRLEDAKLRLDHLKKTQAAQDSSAETDQFKCGKCKQRKTKYYQMQTRSADEPMTTYVTCINCGHRWKFC